MKKIILTFLLSFSLISVLSAQDLVIDNYGNRYNCNITNVDSTGVSFQYYKGDDETVSDTTINKENLFSYQYAVMMDEHQPGYDAKNCISVGLLAAGSTLAGVEYERFFGKYFGWQVGVGVAGAATGFNFHIAPTIRSSYASIMCWMKGFGANNNIVGYRNIMVGPSFTLRTKKWFTGTVGVGYICDRGNAFSDKFYRNIPVSLILSLGAYFTLEKRNK